MLSNHMLHCLNNKQRMLMGKEKERDEVREKEGRWKKRKGETLRAVVVRLISFKDKL